MTVLEYNPEISTNKLLLNADFNKLATCVCCCPGLIDKQLYVHIACDESDCICTDVGKCISRDIRLGHLVLDNCDDWEYDLVPDVQGCCESDGTPQVEFSSDAHFYCYPTDEFRLDLCLGDNPQYQTIGTCNLGYWELSGDAATANTCDAAPGEFFLDFGFIQPTECGLGCGFRVWIDENPTVVFNDYAFVPYNFPALGSNAQILKFLRPQLWFWEFLDRGSHYVLTPFNSRVELPGGGGMGIASELLTLPPNDIDELFT